MESNLDRFSQRAPSEKFRIRVVTLDPECEVCGREMDQKFLKPWNGKKVCTQCINELTQEVDTDDLI